ncbi:MAG: hypothetical protein AAB425_12790 [Bdellovibrionota bacterium]
MVNVLSAALFSVLIIGANTARASPEWDRQYALETVGLLPAWDNADGIFVDYLKKAFEKYFNEQSRFVLKDIAPATELLRKSKVPYEKLIEDREILTRLSHTARVESLVRIGVRKDGNKYSIKIDWLHAPKIEILGTVTAPIEPASESKPGSNAALYASVAKAIDQVIARVPFRGQITGRDSSLVTVNIGKNAALRKNDILVIGTVEDVSIHPLLKQINTWSLVKTGRLVVETVDDKMAFCKVVDEEIGKKIDKYQKITQVISPMTP